jgi:hypothetical protein
MGGAATKRARPDFRAFGCRLEPCRCAGQSRLNGRETSGVCTQHLHTPTTCFEPHEAMPGKFTPSHVLCRGKRKQGGDQSVPKRAVCWQLRFFVPGETVSERFADRASEGRAGLEVERPDEFPDPRSNKEEENRSFRRFSLAAPKSRERPAWKK